MKLTRNDGEEVVLTPLRRCRPSELRPAEIETWHAACATSEFGGDAFLSPTFALAAESAYSRVEVLVCSGPDGNAVAFLPLQYNSRTAQVFGCAVRVGEEMSDCFGIAGFKSDERSIADLLQSFQIPSLYYTHLRAGCRKYKQALPGDESAARRQFDCDDVGVGIELTGRSGDFSAQIEARDKNLVRELRRRSRKASETLGVLRFDLDVECNRARTFDQLIQQKSLQYLQTTGRDWLTPRRKKLLHLLYDSRSVTLRPVLSTLCAGDEWLASHFGLMSGGRLHYWLPVYNPEHRKLAPGKLMMYELAKRGHQFGVDYVDRGAGYTTAKREFGNRVQAFKRGLWCRAGFVGCANRLGYAVAWRAKRIAR